MSARHYTIGVLSRLTGESVRRIRFYSDAGLLAAARTGRNYRVYTEADAARVDLIRALRSAGIGLDAIRNVLARKLSLSELLRIRLAALDAEIAASRRVAAVLRATLRSPEPTDDQLKRLWTVTKLSQDRMRQMIEGFYDRVWQDVRIDADWKRRMIAASTPELPDEPSPEQIDAWIELAGMLTDETLIAEMRGEMGKMWNDEFDPQAYAAASDASLAKVRAAMDAGLQPDSPIGVSIAREWLEASARAMGRAPDAAYCEWVLEQYRKHAPRSARYQALLAILQGDDAVQAPAREWHWVNEALRLVLETEAA